MSISDGDGCVLVSYQEGFEILDTLQNASAYLVAQYRDSMTRDEAQAHFDARTLLLKHRLRLLNEMELEYKYGGAGEADTPKEKQNG